MSGGAAAAATEPRPGTTHGDQQRREDSTVTDRLIEIGSRLELSHDADGATYATAKINGHYETWRLTSDSVGRYLQERYFRATGRSATLNCIRAAVATLDARAQFDAPQRAVYCRVAVHGDDYYVDLCDDAWRAVRITRDGWELCDSPPVRFVRARGMRPLATPTRDGSLDALRAFLNLPDERAWHLILAWLVQALWPTGPYPILLLQGGEGTAKTTAAKVLRMLVDPNSVPLRGLPRNEDDLAVSTANSRMLIFDNVSKLSDAQSDQLCRVSTGGGFAKRKHYSDDGECVFEMQRPMIVTGIGRFARRQDFLSRSLVLELEPVPQGKRRYEDDLLRDFEAARRPLQGALFDAIAAVRRELPSVTIAPRFRLADFERLAVALERALRWPAGAAQRALGGNAADAAEAVIEASPTAVAVRGLVARRGEWTGQASELLQVLSDMETDAPLPTRPHLLTAELTRIAGALRHVGIVYERPTKRTAGKRPAITLRAAADKEDE